MGDTSRVVRQVRFTDGSCRLPEPLDLARIDDFVKRQSRPFSSRQLADAVKIDITDPINGYILEMLRDSPEWELEIRDDTHNGSGFIIERIPRYGIRNAFDLANFFTNRLFFDEPRGKGSKRHYSGVQGSELQECYTGVYEDLHNLVVDGKVCKLTEKNEYFYFPNPRVYEASTDLKNKWHKSLKADITNNKRSTSQWESFEQSLKRPID